MAAFSVKGVCIGQGRPRTIVPLLDAELGTLLASARRAVAAGADCVEWRADFWADPHDAGTLMHVASELVAALPTTPVIATLRTKDQGGRLVADDEEYQRLVRALIWGGADIVDVELSAGGHASDYVVRELVEDAQRVGLHAIVSQHDFKRTPPAWQMERTLLSAVGVGADIAKLAVMATCDADAMRLMGTTSRVAQTVRTPLLTMAMGPAGGITRLTGESFGSTMTFCALGEASAPGQIGLAQATAALDALHVALAGRNGPAGATR